MSTHRDADRPQDRTDGHSATDAAAPDGDRYRVLIVEDNPDHVWMLQRTLTATGRFDVTVARNAREGRRAVEEKEFDAIVSDHRLPDAEGLRFIREIRDGGFAGIVLLVTAQATEEVASGGLDAGATDYVFKARGYPTRVLEELLERLGETG